jgi:2-oxoglutarate ferredoxin oxidoreductase subunit delta
MSENQTPARKQKAPPLIEIKVSWCKGCGLCVDYCNLGVLEMNGTLPQVVKLDKCTRCMQCEVICPDFAIRVTDPPQKAPDETRGEGQR